MKILILKPSSLGDVIHALPVLRLLRRHLPHAAIHWWIDARLSPLLEGDPDLTGVVRFERQRWGSPLYWPEMWRSVRWMRAQAFDWVIDLQCLARSSAFAWLASGKLLVGLDEPREGARALYDLIVPRATYHTHAVDWYLGVLSGLGVPADWNFHWLPVRSAVAADVKSKWRTDGARWVALQPGTRWLNKRWPAGHFAELAREIVRDFPEVRFVILGGRGDEPLGQTISQAAPERCLNLAGQTSLPEMVEWLRLCALVVTNDTGPAHAAAALGKPTIALYGPTEPRRTGPYGQLAGVLQHPLPCAPCMKSRCRWPRPMECLTAITPASVAGRVRAELLSQRASERVL